MNQFYIPQEDSFLLNKHVKKYSFGRVLDLGTGSGIQAFTVAEDADEVVAVDIDEKSVEYVRNEIKNRKIKSIKILESDLFENVKGKFDLIIFNPPYLPFLDGEDESISRTVSGGKMGYEIIERFLGQAGDYLNENGKILLVFSSLTGEVFEIMKRYKFDFEMLEEKRFDFEKLYVCLVKLTN
ncbi:MAG: methyltransferase [Candidatus Woesearchaeota archaeon]|nr:MAG: methyltransferase [Candidatus Woesearchaeota archaeon]